MFALTIAPMPMNGIAASGFSAIFAKPPSSTIPSGGTPPNTAPATFLISPASLSAAPLTAPSPVTANWIA